jgi:5'-deoxynucleotidase YfbR-like HD superfamily hydrolase
MRRPAVPAVRKPAAAPAPRAWQRMLSGRRLDLLDPSPLDVEIEDIAHGLARVARWNGQTTGAQIFSVAQHALLVETLAGRAAPGLARAERLTILLHDAPEYVVGDLISPFKAVLGGDYREVEARLLGAIHLRFSLPAKAPARLKAICKSADRVAAWLEATRVAGFSVEEADAIFGRPEVDLAGLDALFAPLPADDAKAAFLARFRVLDGG